jgi:hypothetical protein
MIRIGANSKVYAMQLKMSYYKVAGARINSRLRRSTGGSRDHSACLFTPFSSSSQSTVNFNPLYTIFNSVPELLNCR